MLEGGYDFFLVPSSQQEHEQDGADQNGECAHRGDDDFSHHLHVAGQRICKTHLNSLQPCCIHILFA